MAFDVCGSPKAAKHYLAWLYEEALWTLDAHWNLVEEIAANLLDNKHLTAQQVRVAIDRAIEK